MVLRVVRPSYTQEVIAVGLRRYGHHPGALSEFNVRPKDLAHLLGAGVELGEDLEVPAVIAVTLPVGSRLGAREEWVLDRASKLHVHEIVRHSHLTVSQ